MENGLKIWMWLFGAFTLAIATLDLRRHEITVKSANPGY
jgi:hypothetical protein